MANMFGSASENRKNSQQNLVNSSSDTNNFEKKLMSAQVSVKQYDKFSQINKIKNVSNNSCINSFINDYVRENSYLLQ